MPIQLHQNINLAIFLILGTFVAHIYLGWIDIFTIIIYTIFIEHIFLYLNSKREFYFSYSAISTAIGVIVLMYATSLWIYLIVITLALFQKHYLTIQNRHFFNPSNFAIIMALLLFYNKAHIISGAFGDELWLGIVVFLVAIIMLIRVNRWIISLLFIISYLLLQYYLLIYYDPVLSFEMIYRRFYSVSFMLFIYFMLTDPVVTPKDNLYQAIFGFLIALISTLLDMFYGFRVQHLFMAVFILSPFITILNYSKTKKDIYISITIMIFVFITITVIQYQPPFYFEMEG